MATVVSATLLTGFDGFRVSVRRLLGKYLPCALEVQDQTKNGLWDDRCKGFPTTNGQSLVFGLPGCVLAVILEIGLPSYMASLRETPAKFVKF